MARCCLVATVRLAPPAPTALPERLTDDQFWAFIADASEPGGSFRSDNLLSNELQLQHVIPELVKTVQPGRAYLGVGPEQNFTYIAALKPSIAFIVDIRRGNLNLHLLYKALFELSADRAAFVSRLFSKARPAASPLLRPQRTFSGRSGTSRRRRRSTRRISRRSGALLTTTRKLPLSKPRTSAASSRSITRSIGTARSSSTRRRWAVAAATSRPTRS